MSWSNTKFSELSLQELMVDSKENYKFDLGVKGLSQALIEMGQLVFLCKHSVFWNIVCTVTNDV